MVAEQFGQLVDGMPSRGADPAPQLAWGRYYQSCVAGGHEFDAEQILRLNIALFAGAEVTAFCPAGVGPASPSEPQRSKPLTHYADNDTH